MEPSSFLLDERATFDFGGFTPGWRTRIEEQDERAGLLSCLTHDLNNTLVLIAGCASLANFAAVRPEFEQHARRQIEQYLPSEPRSIPAILGRLSRRRELSVVCSDLLRLYAMLELARSSSRSTPVVDDVTWTIDELAALLCKLCGATLDVLQQMNGLLSEIDPDNGQQTGEVSVERIAVAAGCGGWPCVGEDGLLRIPGWVERRARSRTRVEGTWRLEIAGAAHAVKLLDLSSRGVGIEDAPRMKEGETVRLVPDAGPELQAEVVWQLGKRCGLRFRQALGPDVLKRLSRQPSSLSRTP